ncbi:MAG: beta-propeller fold lactonase family protein [Terracidiphilus sp.]
MKIGSWARFLLAAAPLLAGCGDFWQAPTGGSGTGSFTLTNTGGPIVVTTPGATPSNTATITVTPSSSSFTGTVTLGCATTTSPSNATSPVTCSLSSTSLDFSTSDAAQTATLTAATTASPATTAGAYQITVTGSSSGVSSETTSVCVEVSTSTCSSATGTSGYFFVLNQTTAQIVSAQLTSGQVNETAYTLPAEPLAIAVAPNGNFLYVSTLAGIYLYTIESNGTLNNGVAFNSVYVPTTVQVDSTNSWLVFASSGSTQLAAFAINPSTGDPAVTGEGPVSAPTNLPVSTPIQLAISPDGSNSCNNSCYVFVAMGNGGTELVNFNPANGNPFGNSGTIGLQIANSGGGDNAVAVDPTNRLLYIGESAAVSGTQTGGLRAFTISSSGVTPISGSPYSTQGTGPISILPSLDGNYVYVANQSVSGISTDNIASFSVSTGSLTYISATPTAGPTGKMGLAEDSTQGYLLAVDVSGSPDLQGFTMSAGTLTSVFSVATTKTDPAGAFAIAALP